MLPYLSPLIFAEVVCSECGQTMERELVRAARGGRVDKIVYRCVNPKSGCNYQVESDQRLIGMQTPAKATA